MRNRTGILDTFGLRPLGPALRQSWRAIAGDRYLPPSRFGLSSVRIFKPWISLPVWLGRTRSDRRVAIYNLFNRTLPPPGCAHSVRVTFARDFRGGRFTYDGHIGTDFAAPVGTPVTTPAPGIVRRVYSEMNRGGLKVCIDHGDGLFTTACHLSRATVAEGAVVGRGDVIGHVGASGLEFIIFFPWVAPHLHFNVWLNGVPVDPFAAPGEEPLWLGGADPGPHRGGVDQTYRPSEYDPDGVAAGIAACRDPVLRRRLQAIDDPDARATELLLARNFQAPAFCDFPFIYRERAERRPRLDLPFRADEFVGAAFPG